MHLMHLVGIETGGAKGGKAMLEGHGVSIILKSIDVKFKVSSASLSMTGALNCDMHHHSALSPTQITW